MCCTGCDCGFDYGCLLPGPVPAIVCCYSNNLTTDEGLSPTNYEPTLENLNWAGDPMLASTLQNSLSNGRVYELCLRENVSYADNEQEKVFIEVLFSVGFYY